MDNLERDELISAYLDDELSPAERGEVDRWLTEDAGARQLLAGLQSLRSTLHALPKVALPADLADRVLRRAEREMLSGDLRARPVMIRIPTTHHERSTPADWRRFFPRSKRFWRPVGYVSVTIAAALMLMLLTEEHDSELAVAPRAKMSSSVKQLPQEFEPNPTGNLDQPAAAVNLAAPESPAPQSALRTRMSEPASAAKPVAPAMAAVGTAEPEALVVECRVPADTNGDEILVRLLKKHQIFPELQQSPIDEGGAKVAEDKAFYRARDAGTAMYVVHATRSQLDAVLAELHAESSPVKEIEVRTALPADFEQLKIRREAGPQIVVTQKSLAGESATPTQAALSRDSVIAEKGQQESQIEAIFILRPSKPTAE